MNEARAGSAQHVVRPWFLWLTDRFPMSPIWVGGAITAVLLGLVFALRELGLFAPLPSRVISREVGLRILISFCVIPGVGVALMPWMEKAGIRELAALRPWIRRSAKEFEALERSLTHFRARPLWIAVLVGVAIHLLLTSAAAEFSRAPRLTLASIFPLATWMVLAPATYVLFSQLAVFRRLAEDLGRIQLFDLRPLAPFSRVGLRASLFYAALFTIAVASHRDWSTEGLGLPTYILVTMLLWVPSCLGLAMLPIWGAHRRIQAEKHAELDRIGAAMQGAPDGLAGSSMAAHATELRGVALLEYREKVEAVQEWPFGASGLRRMVLYVLIPPLGWLGGALVERTIDSLLQ
jgi:hypothetical protein